MNWLTYRNLLGLILLVCICTVACKKYSEGPAIALRTVKKRITGSWEIKRLLVDEIDETSALLAHPANCLYVIRQEDCNTCYALKMICQSVTKDRELFLEDNKEEVRIRVYGITSGLAYGPVGVDTVSVYWKILKLTNKEMKLKTSYIDGKEYELTFSKK